MDRHMRFLVGVAVFWSVLAGSTVFAAPAEAKYSLCNLTSYAMRASIGYVDGDRLATRGWWPMNPGQCKIVLTNDVVPGRYFVFGEAIDGHKGPKRTWSGDTALCVENSGFFNLRNQEVCREEPQNQRAFMSVEVSNAADGTYTTNFVEKRTLTVYSAKVAGVQRLLSDVGMPVDNIDGTMGRETRRAIAAYRKNRGLPDGNSIDDEIISSLIDEANTNDAKLGFFYCNKSSDEVWAAIGYPANTAKSYKTEGWWQMDPGQCIKVLKGELEHDHYYVYGILGGGDAKSPDRVLLGGDKSLCVNDVIFSTDNRSSCADQDLDVAMFKRVEIGGSPVATYDFEDGAFAPTLTP